MAALEQNINQAGLTQLARREHFTFFGLTLPSGAGGAMIIIPIGWLFFPSFIGRDGSFSFKTTNGCELKAYIRIFITTFKISILTTIFCALLGYPLAYFMSQISRKWAICMIGVLIPFWTSLLVRTYAWLVLLQKKGSPTMLPLIWA